MVLFDNGGRPGREIALAPAPPDLASLVEHSWVQRGPHPAPVWRVVADPAPYLIAAVTARAGGAALRLALVGARSCAADLDVSSRTLTVGVRLRPGALPVLIDDAAHTIANRSVPIEQVFHARLLADLQLAPDAPGDLIVFELLRLIRRAGRGRLPSRRLPEAAAQSCRVGDLAARLTTPTRSLREASRRDVGFGPKRLLRILRLHAALRAIRRPGASWAYAAAAAGYADQSHLTREVRLLLGETPSRWAARGAAVSSKTAIATLR
jgi:AraC-like DNA-binding protein